MKYSSDTTALLSHRIPSAALLALLNEGRLINESCIYLYVKLSPWTSLVLVIRRMVNRVSCNCLGLQMSHMKVSCRQLRQHEVENILTCFLVRDNINKYLSTFATGSFRSKTPSSRPKPTLPMSSYRTSSSAEDALLFNSHWYLFIHHL